MTCVISSCSTTAGIKSSCRCMTCVISRSSIVASCSRSLSSPTRAKSGRSGSASVSYIPNRHIACSYVVLIASGRRAASIKCGGRIKVCSITS